MRWVVESTLRKSLKIFTLGGSLRRRVAFSLAVVRLFLVPVIFLAVYYLFGMGVIVDRIVNVDAPVTSLAVQASVQMLDARRAERSYFLLRDPQYLQANKDSSAQATRGRSATCDANGTFWPAKPMMKHASDPAYQSRKPSKTSSVPRAFDVSNAGQGLLKAGL
jgi:hypothetical protein